MIQCKDCRYYRKEQNIKDKGRCVLNPPVIVIIGNEPVSLQPGVSEESTCNYGTREAPVSRIEEDL